MSAFLRAEGVTRRHATRHGEVVAVNDVSLTIDEGARLGVVGESGSGKSTLLRMLAGLERPDSGTVSYRGREIRDLDRRELRRAVQVVLQDPASSLNPRMSVRSLVAEPLVCLYGRDRDTDGRVAAAVAEVGLDADIVSRLPRELSGGQRQRVAIARALVARPRVLLADEPVSALDVLVRDGVLDLFDALTRDHRLTTVVVSHDLAVVARLCDTIAVVRDGRIVEQGSTAEVLSSPRDPFTARLIEAVPQLG